MLASQLDSPPGLTCAHVAAALRGTESYQSQLVRKVADKITDLASGRAALEAELSDWHKILCKKDLDRAVAGAANDNI